MSGRIAKSQVPWIAHAALPPAAKMALINAKNALRAGVTLRGFGNDHGGYPGDGPPLPQLDQGCIYLEVQVGEGRSGSDGRANRGSHRLVLEVEESTGRIRETYYTEDHYEKFTFFRVA